MLMWLGAPPCEVPVRPLFFWPNWSGRSLAVEMVYSELEMVGLGVELCLHSP